MRSPPSPLGGWEESDEALGGWEGSDIDESFNEGGSKTNESEESSEIAMVDGTHQDSSV